MTAAASLLAAVIVSTLWLAALLALRAHRHTPQVALVAALALFSTAHVAAVGSLVAPSAGPWDVLWLGPFLFAHAGVCAYAMTHFPTGRSRLRGFAILGIIAVGGVLTALGIAEGWRISEAFQPPSDIGRSSLNAYPVVCLAVALGEALAAWRRSPYRRKELSWAVMGLTVLIVGGPVYGFELTILGLTKLVGTNLGVPVAAVFFALGLWRSNPLPFRGHPLPSVEVPWQVPPGVYFLDERRPTYAEATFLAIAEGEPALAIVSSSEVSPELAGVESARLPRGERCASVLAATASEFLSRHPRGAVLVEDASYAITHNGIAAVDAIRSVILDMPRGASLVISLAKLSPGERLAFRTLRGTWLSPPELSVALAAIMRTRLGSADLLSRAALSCGKRIQDLSLTDVPALSDSLRGALHELRPPSDRAAQAGWSRVVDELDADLLQLWRTPPTQMSTRNLAPAEATLAGVGIVKASSIPELETSVPDAEPGPPLGESIREAFIATLGPGGDPAFREVLRALRKEPSALASEDLGTVARLADDVIADFGGALDVTDASQDLLDRARRLQVRLARLAWEGR